MKLGRPEKEELLEERKENKVLYLQNGAPKLSLVDEEGRRKVREERFVL